MCSSILNYNETDGNINILLLLKRIIQNHFPVSIFSGDQDSVVTLLGSRTLVRELAHDLHYKVFVPYGAWFHKGQVGGWASDYGNLLTFATVRDAAHMVPSAQPPRALHLFSSLVRGRRLPNTNPYFYGRVKRIDHLDRVLTLNTRLILFSSTPVPKTTKVDYQLGLFTCSFSFINCEAKENLFGMVAKTFKQNRATGR